jgi:hypothetical protein
LPNRGKKSQGHHLNNKRLCTCEHTGIHLAHEQRDSALHTSTRDSALHMSTQDSALRYGGLDTKREACLAFNAQLTSYRQFAEWGMRAFQGSFGRLRVRLDIGDNHGRARLLEVCIRLNNLRANCVGISQIRSIYQPVWMVEHDDMWFNFVNMVFWDICAQDCVGRYHHLNQLNTFHLNTLPHTHTFSGAMSTTRSAATPSATGRLHPTAFSQTCHRRWTSMV